MTSPAPQVHDGGADPQPSPLLAPCPSRGRIGLYYYTASNANHDIVEAAVRLNAWVGLLAHQKAEPANDAQNPPGLRQRLQERGIPVLATGWLEPSDDDGFLKAQAEAAGIASRGHDEYMANAENAWGYESGHFLTSDRFCPMLGAELHGLPVSLSVEVGEQIHLRPWLNIGLGVVRPQTYRNAHADLTLTRGYKCALQQQADAQLVPEQVELTLGWWENFMPGGNFGAFYAPHVDDARADGYQGPFSVWPAEFLTEADIDALYWLNQRGR